MRRFAAVGVMVVVGLTSGCSDDGGGAAAAGTEGTGAGSTNGPTFHKDVAPILHQSCLGCHRPGQIGGFSLEQYESAKALSGKLVEVTETGRMPPFLAQDTAECQPRFAYRHDPRLSAEEIATLRAWHEAGAPEGDPADGPPPFTPPPDGLPEAELSLAPVAPTTVDGESDQFICVVYDPQLTSTRFLDGVHILPQNAKIAHHALINRADRAQAAQLAGPDGTFDCFGGVPGDLIHGWAPGGQPLQLPESVGIQLDPDQVLVVQMHYHPTGTGPEQDASTIQLRFLEAPPLWLYGVGLPGNAASSAEGLHPGPNDNGAPEFRVPANVADHVEEMEWIVPDTQGFEVPVLAVANHMHYVGVDMRVWVERGIADTQPQTECFIHTPRWDFNWQMFYQFDVPIAELPTLSTGDRVILRCKYDNTMANPFVVQALADLGLSMPIDVTLGEGTLDEMCIFGIGYLVPNL